MYSSFPNEFVPFFPGFSYKLRCIKQLNTVSLSCASERYRYISPHYLNPDSTHLLSVPTIRAVVCLCQLPQSRPSSQFSRGLPLCHWVLSYPLTFIMGRIQQCTSCGRRMMVHLHTHTHTGTRSVALLVSRVLAVLNSFDLTLFLTT